MSQFAWDIPSSLLLIQCDYNSSPFYSQKCSDSDDQLCRRSTCKVSIIIICLLALLSYLLPFYNLSSLLWLELSVKNVS